MISGPPGPPFLSPVSRLPGCPIAGLRTRSAPRQTAHAVRPPARLSRSETFLVGAAVKVRASPIAGVPEDVTTHRPPANPPPPRHTTGRRFPPYCATGGWKSVRTGPLCVFMLRVPHPPRLWAARGKSRTILFALRLNPSDSPPAERAGPRTLAPLFCFKDPWPETAAHPKQAIPAGLGTTRIPPKKKKEARRHQKKKRKRLRRRVWTISLLRAFCGCSEASKWIGRNRKWSLDPGERKENGNGVPGSQLTGSN